MHCALLPTPGRYVNKAFKIITRTTFAFAINPSYHIYVYIDLPGKHSSGVLSDASWLLDDKSS